MLYELSDQVVANARALIVKAPITFEQAAAVQEVLVALSKPVEEEKKVAVLEK